MSDINETEVTVEKRKRGRPKGSLNRAAKFKNYNPKRWQPEFDLMVIESISGKSNEEIGQLFGYTKEHVSNILSTTQAGEVKERVRKTINAQFQGTLQERIANIGAKAIEHVEKFIQDDSNLASKSPFMFVDRALKIAQSTSTLVSNPDSSRVTNNTVNGNVLVINNDIADNLFSALEKSRALDEFNESFDPSKEIKALKAG